MDPSLRIVEAIYDLIYEVENLSRTRIKTVHAQRINPYVTHQPHDDVSKELMDM